MYGLFVGYGETTKGYRVYFPDRNIVEVKANVDFIVKSAPTRENVVDREKLGYVDLSADDVGPEETADQGEDREGG